MGTWRRTTVKQDSPFAFAIEADGTDGIRMLAPDLQYTMSAKFDGKEYPQSGPTVPTGSTTSLKRIDGNTIEETDRLNGKVLNVDTLRVSPDRKTLTITSRNPNAKDPPTVWVYDRQR